MDSTVEYRDIPSWPDYRAGDDGTIWSRKLRGGNNRTPGRVGDRYKQLSECLNSSGYPCVNLRRDGRNFIVPVCYLVLEAFVGPRLPGMQACHFPDRNRANSRRSNLRWDTPSGNQQDRKAHGTVRPLRGDSNPHAKLTPSQVHEIVVRRSAGEQGRALAAIFKVSAATISRIWLGKSWSHTTGRGNVNRGRSVK